MPVRKKFYEQLTGKSKIWFIIFPKYLSANKYTVLYLKMPFKCQIAFSLRIFWEGGNMRVYENLNSLFAK